METYGIRERIQEVVNHSNLTVNAFSKQIGLSSNTVIGRILATEGRTPSYMVLRNILITYPEIDANWLLTGKGIMLREESGVASGTIPYHKVLSSQDMVSAIQDERKPDSVIQLVGFSDCDYAFDMIGDQMSPRLNSGEIILCKITQAMIPGQIYLVVTEEVQLIRYLREIHKEEYVFSAHNKEYNDFILKADTVKTTAVVKGKIRREMY